MIKQDNRIIVAVKLGETTLINKKKIENNKQYLGEFCTYVSDYIECNIKEGITFIDMLDDMEQNGELNDLVNGFELFK